MDWQKLPWIDISFVLLACWYMVRGYKRGFIAASFDALGFFGGFVLSLFIYAPVAAWISASFGIARPFAKPLAFFGLIILLEYAMSWMTAFIYRRIPVNVRKAKINRAFGVIPGFADAAFTTAIMLSLTMSLPMPQAVKKEIESSPTGRAAIALSGALDGAFTNVFGGAIKETLSFVTIHPGSDEAVDLRFHTDGFAPDAAAESAMLKLVNAERVKQGLRPLVENAALTRLARAHSADMLTRGYFSHITPEGVSPSGRAEAAGIPYQVFGENLALSPDVPTAHQGLMNSPGHRANILSPDYGKIGIGIQDAGIYGIMVTQNFSD